MESRPIATVVARRKGSRCHVVIARQVNEPGEVASIRYITACRKVFRTEREGMRSPDYYYSQNGVVGNVDCLRCRKSRPAEWARGRENGWQPPTA